MWHTQLDKVSEYHAKIQRNLMIQFQEKNPTDSKIKDEETRFHRTLPATAWGPASKTTLNYWHLKVKDTEHDVGLTKKMSASQSACKKSTEFTNSFFRYKRFSSLMNSNGHAHFLSCPPKNHWNNF